MIKSRNNIEKYVPRGTVISHYKINLSAGVRFKINAKLISFRKDSPVFYLVSVTRHCTTSALPHREDVLAAVPGLMPSVGSPSWFIL
jgi:hypothetical protein